MKKQDNNTLFIDEMSLTLKKQRNCPIHGPWNYTSSCRSCPKCDGTPKKSPGRKKKVFNFNKTPNYENAMEIEIECNNEDDNEDWEDENVLERCENTKRNSPGRKKKSKGGRPKKNDNELRKQVQNLQKKLGRYNTTIEMLKGRIQFLENELRDLKQRTMSFTLIARKNGQFYNFKLAKEIVNLRIVGGISLRNVKPVAIAACNCFFENSHNLELLPFPGRTTVSIMQKAIAYLSKDFEKTRLEDINYMTLMFDSSTQFQNFDFFAASVNYEKDGKCEQFFMDMVPICSGRAENMAKILKDILVKFRISLAKKIWFFVGDVTNSNSGQFGGVTVYLASEKYGVIAFIKCNMHVLQYCFLDAKDYLYSQDTLQHLEFVINKLNDDKFVNSKLLECIAETFKIPIAPRSCKTRIAGQFKSCEFLVHYLSEVKELAILKLAKDKDSAEWKKMAIYINNPFFIGDISFLYDFFLQIFLPFLHYFEIATTFEEKIRVNEKILEFKTKVDKIQLEIKQFKQYYLTIDSDSLIFKNSFNFLFENQNNEEITEYHLNNLVGGWESCINRFSQRYFLELKQFEQFPFNIVNLFSSDQKLVKKTANSYLLYLNEPNPQLKKYNDLISGVNTYSILERLARVGRDDIFLNSEFCAKLKSVIGCMVFTNVFSERLFSIQNCIHRARRNMKQENIRDYLFLCTNKTILPDNDPMILQKYYELMHLRGISDEEQEISANEVFDNSFFEEHHKASRQYAETIQKLMSKSW